MKVELALDIMTTTNLCFKWIARFCSLTIAQLILIRYDKILIEICATFKDAKTKISERTLRVKIYWKRTIKQLDFLKQIWESLDQKHKTL